MEKRKWSGLKKGIFLYLVIFHCVNIIRGAVQSDFENTGFFVIERIVNQDLPIILAITCAVIINIIKGNRFLKLVIGYVVYVGILFICTVAVQWIFQGYPITGLLVFRASFLRFTIKFVIISVILSLKEHFMNKRKEVSEEADMLS